MQPRIFLISILLLAIAIGAYCVTQEILRPKTVPPLINPGFELTFPVETALTN
jgi:hypothetical protein